MVIPDFGEPGVLGLVEAELVAGGELHVEVGVDGVGRVPDEEDGAARGKLHPAEALREVGFDDPSLAGALALPPEAVPPEHLGHGALGTGVAARVDVRDLLEKLAKHGVARPRVGREDDALAVLVRAAEPRAGGLQERRHAVIDVYIL